MYKILVQGWRLSTEREPSESSCRTASWLNFVRTISSQQTLLRRRWSRGQMQHTLKLRTVRLNSCPKSDKDVSPSPLKMTPVPHTNVAAILVANFTKYHSLTARVMSWSSAGWLKGMQMRVWVGICIMTAFPWQSRRRSIFYQWFRSQILPATLRQAVGCTFSQPRWSNIRMEKYCNLHNKLDKLQSKKYRRKIL